MVTLQKMLNSFPHTASPPLPPIPLFNPKRPTIPFKNPEDIPRTLFLPIHSPSIRVKLKKGSLSASTLKNFKCHRLVSKQIFTLSASTLKSFKCCRLKILFVIG
jgi:hypothetical protein